MLVGGDRNLAYRTKTTFSSSTTATKPSGVAIGDLVFVLIPTATASGVTLTTNSGAAWTRNEVTGTSGYISVLYWKVLNATDVTNSWDISTAAQDGLSVRYQGNGATTATVKATTANGLGATTLVLTGFTVASGSRGVLAVLVDADLGATDTEPTNFVSRHHGDIGLGSVTFADRVSGYAGGNVTFTNTGPTNPEHGWLVEVT